MYSMCVVWVHIDVTILWSREVPVQAIAAAEMRKFLLLLATKQSRVQIWCTRYLSQALVELSSDFFG